MALEQRLTFFVDVDNTLIDNDAAKDEIDRKLEERVGIDRSDRFWKLYEEVRATYGVVDIPRTLGEFLSGEDDRALRFALADLFMTFPYTDYLYPETLNAMAHLKSMGTVAILSDGDPVFQMSKITRSGLAAAADGYVAVFRHKEDHLEAMTAAFAADHFVLIDDKPGVIERVSARALVPLTTVFVRQGHYAASTDMATWTGADLSLNSIGEIQQFDRQSLVAASRND
jgi:FMN phosphatase YigB (HAD superfamily)